MFRLISKRIGLSVPHQPFLTPKENTMSKILLIGASGTIGQAVLANLGARHDVITVGRSSGTVSYTHLTLPTICSV